jgi:hypothetical protein
LLFLLSIDLTQVRQPLKKQLLARVPYVRR